MKNQKDKLGYYGGEKEREFEISFPMRIQIRKLVNKKHQEIKLL